MKFGLPNVTSDGSEQNNTVYNGANFQKLPLLKMKDLYQNPFSNDFKFDPNRFQQNSYVQQPQGPMGGEQQEKLRRRKELQDLYLRSENEQARASAAGEKQNVQNEMDYRQRLEKDMLPFAIEDQAAEFRGDGYQNDVFNAFRSNVVRDLAQNSKDASMNMARRGLMSGGMAQAEQAKQVGNAASNLAKGRQDIASAAEDQAKELENAQIQNGIQMRNMQQGAFNAIYNSALQAYQSRNSGMLGQAKQLVRFGGAMAGAPLGAPGMAAGYKAGDSLGKLF